MAHDQRQIDRIPCGHAAHRHPAAPEASAQRVAPVAERDRRAADERARQQRELESAQQLAESESQRADEQGRAATRLRRRAAYLIAVLALALTTAVVAGVFARTGRVNLAQSERLRLAAEANALLDRGASGELPPLLALRSLRTGYTPPQRRGPRVGQ